MPYDAFTIDTNKAIQGGLNLEGGLLGQLTQFKDGQIDLVLSEIVVREIHKHLLDQVKKARDSLSNAAAKVRLAQLVAGGSADQLKAMLDAMPDVRRVAGERLSRYINATGAEAIPAKLAPMQALVDSYFGASPPFDAAGAKKSEFPDAIALLSIEAWAQERGKKVLAVSDDAGWKGYAEKSEYIDVVGDFAKALETVQEHADAAEKAVCEWLLAVESGALENDAMALEEGLRATLAEWAFHGEGSSAFSLELDSAELKLGNYAINRIDDDFDVTIVRIGSSQVVARIGGSFDATATAHFSLSVWDSIDKEEVGMGSQSAEREVDFEGAFLLTLSGDFSEGIDGLEIAEIEFVNAIDFIDFGEIEMDYHDDDDYRAWLAEEDASKKDGDVHEGRPGLMGLMAGGKVRADDGTAAARDDF